MTSEWTSLTRKEQQEALCLIRQERTMWSTRMGYDWDRFSLATVKMRHRALGAAIAELKRTAKKPKRKP